jgi:hypothetical protein
VCPVAIFICSSAESHGNFLCGGTPANLQGYESKELTKFAIRNCLILKDPETARLREQCVNLSKEKRWIRKAEMYPGGRTKLAPYGQAQMPTRTSISWIKKSQGEIRLQERARWKLLSLEAEMGSKGQSGTRTRVAKQQKKDSIE